MYKIYCIQKPTKEGDNMGYMLTWMEGNEVQYRFVSTKDDVARYYIEDRNVIVTPLEDN